MAYTIGTPYAGSNQSPAYTGIFIPTLWSGKLVEKFYAATVLGAIANTDYEGEIRNQGDLVKIRTRPTITIADYEVNQALTIQRPSSNLVELAIDKGKYFNLALDDVMEVQADLDMLSIWAEDAAEQMKIAVDTEVLLYLSTETLLAGMFGNTAGVISGDVRLGLPGNPLYLGKAAAGTGAGNDTSNEMSITDAIVNFGQVLDEKNIPETGRWLLLPAWACAMIKKSDLKDASISGDGTSILRNGRLGMIDRFTIYMSNLLPTADGYSTQTYCYFGVNAALTFAAQFTKMETLRSESTFATLVRGLQVYGRKVVNTAAIGRACIAKG